MKDFFKTIIKGGEAVLLLIVSTIIAVPFLIVLVPIKEYKKQKYDALQFIFNIAESFDAFAIAFKKAIKSF